MKKIFSLLLAGTATFLMLTTAFVPVALAAEFLHPADENGNVTLSSSETHHNAYVAGGSVFINSLTTGDLYAAGGNLTIEGKVEQDVVVAGGTVVINGEVGGDVRVAGGTVIISNKVGGDIVMLAGTLTLTEKASVTGGLYVAGGDLSIDAPVAGEAKLNGENVRINSAITGAVSVMANRSLTFGKSAVVQNKISYKGATEAVVQEGAQVSAVEFQTLPQHKGGQAGKAVAAIFSVMFVLKIVGIALLGLVLIKLFPSTSKKLVGSVKQNIWANLGIGFLALFVAPIALIILAVTIVGIYLAIFVFFVWLVLVLIASIVACVFAGSWILDILTKKTEMVVDWQAVLIGTVALSVLTLIPVLGILIFIILLLVCFGVVLRHLYETAKFEQGSGVTIQS